MTPLHRPLQTNTSRFLARQKRRPLHHCRSATSTSKYGVPLKLACCRFEEITRKSVWLDSYSVDFHCLIFLSLYFHFQKVRLPQSGLTHDVKVQFLWYGTRAGREKSGAYLFLPEEGGARVRVPPDYIHMSLSDSESLSMCLIPPPALFTHRPSYHSGVQWPSVLRHHLLFPSLHAQSSAVSPWR